MKHKELDKDSIYEIRVFDSIFTSGSILSETYHSLALLGEIVTAMSKLIFKVYSKADILSQLSVEVYDLNGNLMNFDGFTESEFINKLLSNKTEISIRKDSAKIILGNGIESKLTFGGDFWFMSDNKYVDAVINLLASQLIFMEEVQYAEMCGMGFRKIDTSLSADKSMWGMVS